MMTKLLLILMVVGLWSGCGGDSPTGDEKKELLVSTTNWDDGGVKEEYQYYHHPETNRKMNHGWYNSYYPNGEYHEVGTYQDNERDGEWTYFTEMGRETTGIYNDGNRNSGEFWLKVRWDESDRRFNEIDEIPNSLFSYEGTFTYSDGKLDGESTIYLIVGDIPADNGRADPLSNSEIKVYSLQYVDGKLQDTWKEWLRDTWGEGKLSNDLANYKGKWVWYYKSGKVEREINYLDDMEAYSVRDGKSVYYDQDGNITDEDIYENGECVEMCEGDE